MIPETYGDLIRIFGKDIKDYGYSLIFLSIIMQAAKEKDGNKDREIDGCPSASDFIDDKNVERVYYELYGIKGLPKLFADKYHRSVENE